jgi:signal transduction histidine kinase
MQWQRMDAVGRLAGGVAHDLKNMFIVVSGYTDLILSAIERENPVRADVEGIRGAVDRAASLTQQLLVLGRNQPLQTKILDFNSLVGTVGSMLEKVLGPLCRLVVRAQASMPHVKADAGKMEQVLLNLTLNARDSMPGGGCVTLETSNKYLGESATRRFGGIEPGSYLVLTVSDTGHGMDTKTLSQIFEPFFTTKKTGQGTGLGLSLVYSIVKQSAGHITVSSEPGLGSTFRIYLPLADKTVEMA